MGITRLRGAAIALAIAAGLALVACGGDDDSTEPISNEGNEELFTTAGFQPAFDAVEEQAGSDAAVLQLQITQGGGADFKLLDGEGANGLIYTGGQLVGEEVEIVGGGSLDGRDFPFTEIDPGAIDELVAGARDASGIEDLEITVLTLERRATGGEVAWVINAAGGGRTGLVYFADPDGTNVTEPTGAAGAGAGAGSP